MHRSGTSLSSSILLKAGVSIGENLMGAGKGNTEGHFENLDFVHFHEKVLRDAGMHSDWGLPAPGFVVNSSYKQEALNIIKSNQAELWGWKDPRTTLFLDYWHELVPDAKFIFLYRSPLEVFISLIRREDQYFLFNPEKFLEVWKTYNERVLAFQKKYPEKTIVAHVDQVTAEPHQFIRTINTKFNFQLSLDFDAEIKKGLLKKLSAQSSIMETEMYKAHPEILSIYKQLNALANYEWNVGPGLEINHPELWSFNDWLKLQAYSIAVPVLQQKVEKMKTSKFWQLRNWWFKVKGTDAEV